MQGEGLKKIGLFLVLFLVSLSAFSGCSSLSNRQKSLMIIAGGALVGGVVGYTTAPDGTLPIAHAALFGSTAAAVCSVSSLFLFDEQKRSQELDRKLQIAQREIDALLDRSEKGEKILYQSSLSLGKNLPEKYKDLVQPGNWSVYQLDQWISQGDNVLVHQDKMLKIVQAHFNLKKGSSSVLTMQADGEEERRSLENSDKINFKK